MGLAHVSSRVFATKCSCLNRLLPPEKKRSSQFVAKFIQSHLNALEVVLHWSTCSANLQRRFATHVSRMNLQTCYTFESLSKTCNTLQHCKYREKSFATGRYTRMIFRATSYHHASWRCKLTSVTPP